MDTSLPKLERVGLLGAGATSSVELARLAAPWSSLPAGTEVAVKRLLPHVAGEEQATHALLAEAKIGARVAHDSLVRVLASGWDDDGPLLVLSYVPGRTLAQRLAAEGPVPEPLTRQVGVELAGALAALHEAGVVHGDLKPENVRLDSEGRAVLLDLGFARVAAGAAPVPDGGSLPYLAPERAEGKPPGFPSDVFALGLVLYELVTGVHPYHARARLLAPQTGASPDGFEGGADGLLAALASGRIAPPSALMPEISPFLDALLLYALARAPEDRPSAAELALILTEGESGTWWRAHVGPDEDAAARAHLRGLHTTPLVGREDELEVLSSLLEGVLSSGGGAIAWLVGPEGSGKWRLAREFAARARLRPEPPIYLYARWTEGVEALPAGALSLLLNRWLQLPLGHAAGPRERERLGTLLPPAAADTLAAALESDPKSDGEAPAREAVGAALAEWLTILARRRPAIVFLDDLHRAGPVTLEALSAVVARLARMRVLLVLGMREENLGQAREAPWALHALIAHAGRGPNAAPIARIELEPLTEGAVAELVRQTFHRTVPRLRLSEVLWQRSRGNPGLIAEILNEMRARGAVEPAEGGRLRLLIAPDELPMPASLHALIAERLRAVAPEVRVWLERLAVAGGRIEPGFLRRAFPPTTAEEMDELLARLVREGWLVPAGSRHRFARPALREAVYRAIPPQRRVRLHAAAARGLVEPEGQRSSPGVLFQRAFHLRAAEEHAETLAVVLELVARIQGRASAQRMLIIARWGLEAVEALPETPERRAARLSLLETAADAADRLGARDEQRELLDRLVDLNVVAEEDPASAARLYVLHGRYAAGTGQFGLARGFLRNAIQLVRDTEERSLLSEAKRRLAGVQAQIGELAEARQLALEALADAQSPTQRSLSHLALAQVDALEDRFEEGLKRLTACLRALRRERVPPRGIVGFASLMRARLLRSAGRSKRALSAARRAVHIAERAGERRFEVEARARLGVLLLDVGRTEEAETQLREALLASREIEDRRGQVIAEIWLAILLAESDDATVRDVVARAAEAAHEIGFYRAEAVALAIRARILRADGDIEAALDASQRAAELVEMYGAELVDRIVCLGTRALTLDLAGRPSEARALVRDLRRRMRSDNARIRSADLRRGQRAYSTRLLELVLSPDGPIYPRVRD